MSKRTTSDEHAQASLLGELKKEFAAYTAVIGSRASALLGRYPKFAYTAMVVSILLSGVLAFTVMRTEKEMPAFPAAELQKSTGPGFGEIIGAGQALKEVLDLQNQINVILHKELLTRDDTVKIKAALDRLEAIQRKVNHTPN